ncbi:MAG: methionine gamma-lyase family protein [Cyanobacteria bacterium SZAS LIN-2]|nr:methionine gamma-lyase family protein [Cyanobacteria bacterium SZAS LIN-2]MBS2009560.1 methionine gamma-lyase family protein [Cyanobacteria bacterium SZAS TMP-1]
MKKDGHKLIALAEERLAEAFRHIDDIAMTNQLRVLAAFRQHKLTEEFFAERTGYGIDDTGREAMDRIFASALGCPSAAVRMQMVSGTHAIACALFGNLRPGDSLISLTGKPYDTLEEVIGVQEAVTAGSKAGGKARKTAKPTKYTGSLAELGVHYTELDLDPVRDGENKIVAAIHKAGPAALYHIQKSRGYSMSRRTLSNKDIGKLCTMVRKVYPEARVFVDNCYGEFVEAAEPTAYGANLMAGSLIKNPGGGLALTGGYVAGDADMVENALVRLTAPGIGGHLGVTFNQNRLVFQGLFMAPSVVAGAVKGAMLVASVMGELGCKIDPAPMDTRFDIIQAIEFGDRKKLVNFCRAIQSFSPVNAHVLPEPSAMPGYADEVIMAGGSFVEGATIELSCDGPLREPYAVYLQGGLSYLHVKSALLGALNLSQSGEARFF